MTNTVLLVRGFSPNQDWIFADFLCFRDESEFSEEIERSLQRRTNLIKVRILNIRWNLEIFTPKVLLKNNVISNYRMKAKPSATGVVSSTH